MGSVINVKYDLCFPCLENCNYFRKKGNRLQLWCLYKYPPPTSLLERHLNCQTGGHPTKSSRASSSAAAFILTSVVQMEPNHLTYLVKQHSMHSKPSSGLRYVAIGRGKGIKPNREINLFSFFFL